MRRDRLVGSTPFRLALIFASVSVGAFLLTGVVVYEAVSWQLRRHQDRTIEETYAVIANAYGDRDLTDLLAAVRTNVRSTRGKERIFLVTGADGKSLGGNIPAVALPEGWSDVEGSRLELHNELVYRVYAGKVDGHDLVVGQSHEQMDTLEEIMLTSFSWASLAVVVIAVAGGIVIAARAERRLDAVRDTLDRVSHGNLGARIPLLGKEDDIDLLARDINGALIRLETTVEGMKQVSADIAHDLKTPLNRLRITIEDALERQGRGMPVLEELETAASEADQINQTFEALLRIAQVESGARKAKFEPLDLGRMLATLADVYADVAEDAGQRLDVVLVDGLACVVSGDRELLIQMYVNLIENAIRHCPAGTRVAVTLRREGGRRIDTCVEDNGPGIPASERERVFHRLYRLEKSRTSPGTGLGLSLVKAVADLHEATIQVEDAHPGLRIRISFADTA